MKIEISWTKEQDLPRLSARFHKTYYKGDARQRYLQQVRLRPNTAYEAIREFVYQHLPTYPCEQCNESDPAFWSFTISERKIWKLPVTIPEVGL